MAERERHVGSTGVAMNRGNASRLSRWSILVAVVVAVGAVGVIGGCAVGESPEVVSDAGSDAGDEQPDTGEPTDADAAMLDTEPDAPPDDPDTDSGMNGCGGCPTGETCHNDRCQDICMQAGAACGEAEWQGATASCGSCGSGSFCSDGSCEDICQTTGAECGEVRWGGTTASCGSCGSGDCVGNRCVQSGGYRDVAGGYRHTCAVKDSGSMACWGLDSAGELGNGGDVDNVTRETTPVAVSDVSSAVTVASNNLHTCAMTSGGTVRCWGFNDEGQLGTGTTGGSVPVPQDVSGLSNATSLGVGNLHTCAGAGGDVFCWGKATFGRLGDGGASSDATPTPQSVKNLTDVVQVQGGAAHTCALKSDGTVWCWGQGARGQLGEGATVARSEPVQTVNLSGASNLAVGHEHTCAIDQSGAVKCWGDGGGGRLGYGGSSLRFTPTDVAMPSDVVAVELAAGKEFTCMRTAGDEVYCWGEYDTQSGTGSFGSTPSTVAVPGTPVAIGAGRDHVCAVADDGSVHCWGGNADGQLGNGTQTDSATPVEVK